MNAQSELFGVGMQILKRIDDHIAYSNTKASFIIGIDGTLLCGIIFKLGDLAAAVQASGRPDLMKVLFMAFLAGVFGSLAYSFFSIFPYVPKKGARPSGSVIYFEGILAHFRGAEAYVETVLTMSPEDLLKDLFVQIHQNALHADRKFRVVRKAVLFFLMGVPLPFLLLVAGYLWT